MFWYLRVMYEILESLDLLEEGFIDIEVEKWFKENGLNEFRKKLFRIIL